MLLGNAGRQITARLIILLSLAGVAGASGCATIKLKASYSAMGALHGEASIGRSAEIRAKYDEMRGTKAGKGVVALVDALPPGLEANGTTISVTSDYKHQILGRFTLSPDGTVWGSSFTNYTSTWRKVVCYPQVPLAWLTGFMWFAVPTYYPCFSNYRRPQRALLNEAKNLAHAANGDLVILSWQMVDADASAASGVTGIIVRMDPRLRGKPVPGRPLTTASKNNPPTI